MLYVEDNPINLLLVENVIATRDDIQLLSALDGLLGIALARLAQLNIILMDINLPGMSGVNVLT